MATNTVYACIHIEKDAEKDSYEHGVDPKSRTGIYSDAVNILARDLPGLIKAIGDHCGMEIDDVWFPGGDPGDEDTRISFNRLEDDDGDEPSKSDMEEFKAGKRTLWLADYDFLIEKRVTCPVTLEEFKAAGIKTHQ